MNDIVENRLSMFKALKKVLDDNNGIWSGLAAYVTAVADFFAKIVEIEQVGAVQESDTKGVTEDKTNYREVLEEQAYRIASATVAYAVDNNDAILKEKVNYPRSAMTRARDTELVEIVDVIYDAVNPVAGSLAGYGVVPGDLTAMQNARDDFNNRVGAPRAAISTRKTATGDLEVISRETMDLLEERLDKLTENFRDSDPDFYQTYHNARLIEDRGHRGTSMKGTVSDANTHVGIKGAVVTIVETGDDRKTNAAGNYRFMKIKAGVYTVEVVAKGYEPETIPNVELEAGKLTDLDVELTPALPA